ncbi:hypothetical protein B0J15DRAFT_589436 [Fusarium solani]|uniref:Uncharacterized protein n=1 Tax=Fusarium solani TaxID=169388 RepID=A0A9P9L588_FUSSL|nr:uncharacterized protein B0J15DRAFT_589436 [Fusarium solani]KAH7274211.1 hypothetical protein B0J15DRAFT_589436 [Fusarium solani]
MSSPESPSRFIYERNPSMSERRDESTNLSSYPSSIQPSEDWPDSPEYYDRFSPTLLHHGHGPFADGIPREAHIAAGPHSRDVTPYEQSSERDDTSTVMSLFSDNGVPGHVAYALNDPGFRCFVARQVHDICLGVSQDFIQGFRHNIEQRLSELQHNESRRFSDRISIFDETARSLYRSTHVTASLMTNTTGICSILWARGNALQMLSPESVSRALENMSVVNTAAEDIARVFDIVLERGDVHEAEARNVLQAGMAFCEILEYPGNGEDLENLALAFQ